MNADDLEHAGGPRTLVGQWLRAAALGEAAERERLRLEIKESLGWRRDELEFVRIAFSTAVIDHFGDAWCPSDVIDFVIRLVDVFEAARPLALRIESMIRHVLGDDSVDVSDISPAVALQIYSLVWTHLAWENSLTSDQMDRLVVAAEAAIVQQGFNPARPRKR